MDGYHETGRAAHGAGEATAQWKSVGDVAYLDDEGYVYICDRKKDMIISGGVNIYPAEIEAVLYRHPQVLDVAVFGIPDDEWGERVHAIVQAKTGETIDLDELRAFAEQHLGGYKRPRAYELRDALAAHRLGQVAQARAARRVLAGAKLRRLIETARKVHFGPTSPTRQKTQVARHRGRSPRCGALGGRRSAAGTWEVG